MSTGDNPRLETWKEVAAFFSRDERTVKRWEVQRGLPVRRLPGAGRSRIYALVDELEAWRTGGGMAGGEADTVPVLPAASAPVAPPPSIGRLGSSDGHRAWWRPAAIALACLLFVSLTWFVWNREHAIRRSTSPSFAAQRAYVAATVDWQKRTPESLERAERGYQAAIASDPDYAPAYVGLAKTYNLLREYTGMPDSQAYPLARTYALKAIALDDTSSDAHAALGFASYWGFWDIPKARAEFARAVELDPRNETAHLWYATFLSNLGEEGAALREIDAARALEPGSVGIATDRALIIALGGDHKAGIEALRRLAAVAPRAPGPLQFIGGLRLKPGDYPPYLGASRRLAAIDGDPKKVAAAAAADRSYRDGGARSLLAHLIAEGDAAYIRNRGPAFDLAILYSLANDPGHALKLLRVSADRRESAFLQITNPANFRHLRTAAAFDSLLARLKPLEAAGTS